jgi:outer membrane murein-binding lipoprotein Lpp
MKVLLIAVAAAMIALTGCSKKSEPAPPAAEVEITEENLDSELDKLEAEIDADIAAEE